MNVDSARKTRSGWIHQRSRRRVSPNRRRTNGTGTVDTAMNTPQVDPMRAYHNRRPHRFSSGRDIWRLIGGRESTRENAKTLNTNVISVCTAISVLIVRSLCVSEHPLEDLLTRLERERLDADRAYNEALTAVDRAIQSPPRVPSPPRPYDDRQIAALNRGWNILPDGAPPPDRSLKGRLRAFVWRLV